MNEEKYFQIQKEISRLLGNDSHIKNIMKMEIQSLTIGILESTIQVKIRLKIDL
jgi:hypothetical protein